MKANTVLLLAAALAFTGCTKSKEPEVVAATPVSERPASPPAATTGGNAIIASGPVVVENQVDVAALREGVIASILIEPGTGVRKGQLLAKLDDRQTAADMDAAAAKVRALEANLENWRAETKVLRADRARAEKLYEAQVIPKEELEHVVYKEEADEFEIKRESEELNRARSLLVSIQLELEKTSIVAPFNGIVARRYVRVGQKVALGERLFWVTAMAPLQVRFTLPERYFGVVRQGTLLSVSSAAVNPEAQYLARVVQVSPVIDPSSGTVEILAQISDTETPLRPGMLVNISLERQP
jgi:membrane fusion protein (multidrug efflux system)